MSKEQETKQAMQATLQHLQEELKHLRTSRANPAMIDCVLIEVYGSSMRLKDIASITTPEARQLLITPFDRSNASAIAKGIEQANLNLLPLVDGHAVRINIPPMDQNTRKEIVKKCRQKGEEAKVSIRDARRKSNEIVRKEKADGLIPEDMQKKREKMIQEYTDQFCKQVDELCALKEKEILEI
ncbi:MAG: ribosome recycling factor [Chlamydiota bacterium]